MTEFQSEEFKNGLLLIARFLLALLFLISGFSKLADYPATVGYMSQTGVPVPQLAAFVATWVEIILSIALVVGVVTRRLAIVLAIYTLATAIIGHRFWGMTGLDRYMSEIHFLKNLCIIAGFLLLYLTGPGGYSLDVRLDKRRTSRARDHSN
jgi:putative oxidoreductase